MTENTTSHGTFCWNELVSTDPDKARDFYKKLINWEIVDSGMPGMKYEMLKAADKNVGGMMKMPEEAKGVPSHWMAYIAVDDVDACAAKVKSLGGNIIHGPQDIPTVGRFLIVQDPTGAVVSLITMKM
jgi:hypothetical protein